MSVAATISQSNLRPLDRREIEQRIARCPRPPSLARINETLRDLLRADQRYTSQISDVIRRDPSLTARMLRLVNSVYYGLETPVNSIEEAVFYLGVKQIRQLATATPIIEDLQRLAGDTAFPWREFWQHCIGTALLTREVLSGVRAPNDETDYVAGLVHDMGKIVMAAGFPEYFQEVRRRTNESPCAIAEVELEVLGISHDELGAIYLQHHRLPTLLVEAAQFHHAPERATEHQVTVAAVQVADTLIRHAKIGHSGNTEEVAPDQWERTAGWNILFANKDEPTVSLTRASLNRAVARLPELLEGLV